MLKQIGFLSVSLVLVTSPVMAEVMSENTEMSTQFQQLQQTFDQDPHQQSPATDQDTGQMQPDRLDIMQIR